MFVTGPIWTAIEITMYVVDAALLVTLVTTKRLRFRDFVLWLMLMVVMPLCGFIAYICVGPPIYKGGLKAPPHTGDGLDEIERLRQEHPEREEQLTFARALSKAGAYNYSEDNEVKYYSEGPDYFKDLLDDMGRAQSSISIECYIIRRDDLSNTFMDILIDRAIHGVQVRIMFDAYGFGNRQMKAVHELRRAGGECVMFHSIIRLLFSPRKNNRDHRKLAVIDGQVGYVGGYNVGDEYINKSKEWGHWRDGAVRFRGTQVRELQTMFAEDWKFSTKKDISRQPELFPPPKTCGKVSMQLVGGGPVNIGSNPLHIQYLTLINDSEQRVYIETPYLMPPSTLFYNLCIRAMSGTDVRIAIPDKPDHPFVYWANRYYANLLMEHGVRVYIYHNGFLHSKLLVGDAYYCSVGSGNLDERSMNLNFECNAMLYSYELGRQLEDAFLNDLQYCTEYSCEEYAKRTVLQKLKTDFSMIFYNQL
ncbi:MAG: cardiolipin synthase [Methanomethylophilus sp.]|nr:cardiolipin synthase [Methanomethylophilus sp.]MDD4221913.1 cardiolipin synthase [Methanomethylophilus sp.]MDD4668898.1 cardiolipin synthase [Methanomethylophilus sp.]